MGRIGCGQHRDELNAVRVGGGTSCVCAWAPRGQGLSGVIESCLQGAALRCSSRSYLLRGEGNHNAI